MTSETLNYTSRIYYSSVLGTNFLLIIFNTLLIENSYIDAKQTNTNEIKKLSNTFSTIRRTLYLVEVVFVLLKLSRTAFLAAGECVS